MRLAYHYIGDHRFAAELFDGRIRLARGEFSTWIAGYAVTRERQQHREELMEAALFAEYERARDAFRRDVIDGELGVE